MLKPQVDPKKIDTIGSTVGGEAFQIDLRTGLLIHRNSNGTKTFHFDARQGVFINDDPPKGVLTGAFIENNPLDINWLMERLDNTAFEVPPAM